MNVFTKRNALVGYLTLTALQRRRWQRRRSRMKLAAFVVLGLISLGILAGIAAVAFRRPAGPEQVEEGETGEAEASEAEPATEVVGEYVTAAAEPIPAA